jgi:hypothetical protein
MLPLPTFLFNITEWEVFCNLKITVKLIEINTNT